MTNQTNKKGTGKQIGREGHRERLRERYLFNNKESIKDHNLLELYLTTVIPQKDVKGISYGLINTFGSLEKIINSSADELTKVSGVGENTAAALLLVNEIGKRTKAYKEVKAKKIVSTQDAISYCEEIMKTKTAETTMIISLSNNGEVLNELAFDKPAKTKSDSETRQTLERIFTDRSAGAIIAKNCNTENAKPAAKDINATIEMRVILERMGIKLIDYILVGRESSWSMKRDSKEFMPD